MAGVGTGTRRPPWTKEPTFGLRRPLGGVVRLANTVSPATRGGDVDIGKIIKEVEIGRDDERDPFAPFEPRPEVPAPAPDPTR